MLLRQVVEMTQKELDDWKTEFHTLDADSSGYLDHGELKALMLAVGVSEADATEAACKNMIACVDDTPPEDEHHGELDFTSFSSLMMLKKVFDSFDNDGSKQIDAKELKDMAESLGINATKAACDGVIKKVDTSGDGEIDFSEFCGVIATSKGPAQGADGISFGSIVSRAKNGGPPMLWEKSEGNTAAVCTTDPPTGGRTLNHAGGGWGSHHLDQWLSQANFTNASVILQITELEDECYIGVVGANFRNRESRPKWDTHLGTSKTQAGMAPFASASSKTGEIFVKGKGGSIQKIKTFGPGTDLNSPPYRVTVDIDMHKQEVQVAVLKQTADGEWDATSPVILENVPNEVAVGVSFLGKASVTVIGSSCEKTAKASATDTNTTTDRSLGRKLSAEEQEARSQET